MCVLFAWTACLVCGRSVGRSPARCGWLGGATHPRSRVASAPTATISSQQRALSQPPHRPRRHDRREADEGRSMRDTWVHHVRVLLLLHHSSSSCIRRFHARVRACVQGAAWAWKSPRRDVRRDWPTRTQLPPTVPALHTDATRRARSPASHDSQRVEWTRRTA